MRRFNSGEPRTSRKRTHIPINLVTRHDKFLEFTYNLSRQNHKEVSLNRPTMSKEIELVIQNLPKKKKP